MDTHVPYPPMGAWVCHTGVPYPWVDVPRRYSCPLPLNVPFEDAQGLDAVCAREEQKRLCMTQPPLPRT